LSAPERARPQYHNAQVHIKKCDFLLDSVSFLGHTISGKGVSVDPEKVKEEVE